VSARRSNASARRVHAIVIAVAWWLAGRAGAPVLAVEIEDGFETPAVSWRVAESDADPRPLSHERSRIQPHRGDACERLEFEAAAGTLLRLELPVGPLAVIDEFACSVWVRGNRPELRLAVRVTLPEFISDRTGRPVETLVTGSRSRDVGRWESLDVAGLPQALARQLPALRLEHGSGGSLASAAVTHVVLDVYSGPGRYEIAIDDLLVTGGVRIVAADAVAGPEAAVRPAAHSEPFGATPTDPPAGLTRGILEVDGLPFFPRSLVHNGEPFAAIAELGFNCVQLRSPATMAQFAEARRAGLWVVCPPPPIPDVDLRDTDTLPTLRNWDRVLLWDLGSGLTGDDRGSLAELARRVRACDPRAGRPLVAGIDSDLRDLSRHVDLLVARRTVLGTTLELGDYIAWLRGRPLLARPGTPLLAGLATEIDPLAARQAAAIAGVGGGGLAVDPESLSMAACAAVAAGARGILFASSTRVDEDGREAVKRAAALREVNLRLKMLEPWAAMGRFTAEAATSDPEVQAFVMEASRARVVMAWRAAQGAQVSARRYAGADIPGEQMPLTILVPGVPEAHQAWEIAAGGLRPLAQRRVTGGVQVTLDNFLTAGAVLFSGEPVITGHMQQRLRDMAPLELAAARSSAAVALAEAAAILGRLPPQALSGPPPVAAGPMLARANTLAVEGDSLALTDPSEAIARLRRGAAIAGQFERRIWENGVKADGSMVASPLLASATALAEHWRFVEARTTAGAGDELLAGGGMDRIDDLAGNGWRQFVQPLPEIRTTVEIAKSSPAGGGGNLRLVAAAADPDAPPAVVETPPLWVTTPPLAAPPGKLLEITAMVRVPAPLSGSVDGLFVFDSLGGPALGERVRTSSTWRRLVLHRIVPADAVDEPLVVTFALTGLGTAEIDEVSIRPLERGAGLVSAPPPVPAAGEPRGFPSPADLLTPRTPVALPTWTGPQWPGRTTEWPRLPFGQSSAPPPGPGGGTVDPFKRARAAGQ